MLKTKINESAANGTTTKTKPTPAHANVNLQSQAGKVTKRSACSLTKPESSCSGLYSLLKRELNRKYQMALGEGERGEAYTGKKNFKEKKKKKKKCKPNSTSERLGQHQCFNEYRSEGSAWLKGLPRAPGSLPGDSEAVTQVFKLHSSLMSTLGKLPPS